MINTSFDWVRILPYFSVVYVFKRRGATDNPVAIG